MNKAQVAAFCRDGKNSLPSSFYAYDSEDGHVWLATPYALYRADEQHVEEGFLTRQALVFGEQLIPPFLEQIKEANDQISYEDVCALVPDDQMKKLDTAKRRALYTYKLLTREKAGVTTKIVVAFDLLNEVTGVFSGIIDKDDAEKVREFEIAQRPRALAEPVILGKPPFLCDKDDCFVWLSEEERDKEIGLWCKDHKRERNLLLLMQSLGWPATRHSHGALLYQGWRQSLKSMDEGEIKRWASYFRKMKKERESCSTTMDSPNTGIENLSPSSSLPKSPPNLSSCASTSPGCSIAPSSGESTNRLPPVKPMNRWGKPVRAAGIPSVGSVVSYSKRVPLLPIPRPGPNYSPRIPRRTIGG